MTLCLLNYEYPPIGAGAASATQEIASSLSRQGHRVVVVTAGIGNLRGERMEDGVLIVRLRCDRRNPDRASLREMGSFMMAAFRELPAIVRTQGCDGIISFFTFPCGPAAWSAWKKTGIPYVVSLRGGDVPGLVPSIHWIHRILGPLRRAILRNAVSVVANAEGLRRLSLASDPLPVCVIPNGVNLERFLPSTEPRDKGVFRVLAVGRLQEQKNHAFALRVLAAARSQGAQSLEYHIIGDGPLRANLEGVVENLGIGTMVFWHGWTPREKLAEIYRRSDCLLHPTLYEGMPNAVLEAMAAGLPVIASDVPGNNDLVRDGQTGYLCRLGDESAFVEAVSCLAGDILLRDRFGHAARNLVEVEYGWDRVARRYLDNFRSNSPRHASPAARAPGS